MPTKSKATLRFGAPSDKLMQDGPIYYTTKEGGYWKPWPKEVLRPCVSDCYWRNKDGVRSININGLQVHALRWADGYEWDIINGFRNKRKEEK